MDFDTLHLLPNIKQPASGMFPIPGSTEQGSMNDNQKVRARQIESAIAVVFHECFLGR